MMVYTNVVKLTALTSEHILNALFQFVVICKMASIRCILYRAKQVSQRVPDLGCEQYREEQSILFLQLLHMCARWYAARHYREGGRLSRFT